ncbi:MAG: DUF6159 family protein [Armatimonadota bacterium]
MKCPSCGEKVYSTDQHCLSCGVRLDEGRLVAEAAHAEDVQAPPRGEPMPRTAFPTESRAAERAANQSAAQPAPGQESRAETSYETKRGRWDPSRLSGERGFMASLKRGWTFLKEAVAMAFRDKDLFIPSVFSVLANIVLIAILGGVLYLTGDLAAARADDEAISAVGYVVLIVATLLIHVTTYFFTGMTVHLVDVHLRGQDAKLGSAFADSVKNVGGIISLAVATLVVGLITGAIRGKGGHGVRRAAADTMQRGWTAITYLLLPIMILEDSPLMKSADRAKGLHSHNIIQIVVGELGLMLTSRVIGAVVVAIGVIVGATVFFATPALLPLSIALVLLFFVLASAFNAYVRTAFYTCLYLWAVAMETVGEEAPAPAPLQPALSAGW